jgi:hypothetical protein
MNIDVDLFKKVNIEKLAKEGDRVYQKIKNQYEPKHNGEYLAIEVESGDVFMAKDGAEAMVKAQRKYPNKVFYLVKIGFAAAETIAKTYPR